MRNTPAPPADVPATGRARPLADVRCEYRRRPLGLDVRQPRLSWQLTDQRRGARQTAYQVLVASSLRRLATQPPDVWDSGVVSSDQSAHVEYAGPPLVSGGRYYWTVRVWDHEGQATPFARPEWWEMGLLDPADWQARWVSIPDETAASGNDSKRLPCRSQYLRREFVVRKQVVRARVYVSGLGCYELWLNGRRVSEDVFAPGWTVYEKRIQYQTYNVTGLLRPGRNAIGAVLGNGWWSGGLSMGRGQIDRTSQGNLRLILQLRVQYADGTHDTILSDDAWKAHPSPIVENTFYHGETHDARLEVPGWNEPDLDDRNWTPVVVLPDPVDRLVAQPEQPIRAMRRLKVRTVAQPRPGVHVLDFGQNHAGRCELRVRGERGARVQLRFAEVLNRDGTLDTRNLVGARSTDVYVLRGDREETWQPRFTYRGYRYVELTGYPGEPTQDTLVSRAVHTAAPRTGWFQCSNKLLNRAYRNILWAQRSNLVSVPTDCPQRDERLGWLGDAHVFAPTACWNMDLATFFTKWLRDIRDSQHAAGDVCDVAPAAVVQGPAAPGWGDALAGIPWTLYRFYGDRRVLEENYAALRAWVEYMRAHAPGHLYQCQHNYKEDGWGDWVAPVESPRKPIAAAFYYYSTSLLARAAAVLGRADDAARYGELAEDIRTAFNAAFFDPQTNNYLGGTQTANILPLAFGITPPERRPAVLENVVRDIEAREGHLSTGFLGTAYVLPLLSNNRYHELAYRVATQRTYPSWGHMIACGATTMCELWNPDTGDPRMNSWNHFALGTVGQWLYECLAGLNFELEPGPDGRWQRRIVIRPRPAAGLTWAGALYRSLWGPVRCLWRRSAGVLKLHAVVPPNLSARICVPTSGHDRAVVSESGVPIGPSQGLAFEGTDSEGFAVFEAGAGVYRFTVEG